MGYLFHLLIEAVLHKTLVDGQMHSFKSCHFHRVKAIVVEHEITSEIGDNLQNKTGPFMQIMQCLENQNYESTLPVSRILYLISSIITLTCIASSLRQLIQPMNGGFPWPTCENSMTSL